MDNEKIKNDILMRLEIEREIRKQLDQNREREVTPTKSRWTWLEGKLALLVIGSAITGVLIPTFQFTQEKIKWHRQNRYDILGRQLSSIRESLKQFIAVQALSAELYDLGLKILDTRSTALREARLEDWRKEFHAIQMRRLQQNSAFTATIFYFPTGSRESIREAWNDLLLPSQQLQTLVGELLGEGARLSGGKAPKKPLGETAVQLDSSISEVNLAYEHVLSMLRQQLMGVENESSKFQ